MVDALSEVNAHKINCHSDYFAPTVAAYKGLTTFFFQHPLYAPEQAATAKANALVSGNDAVTIQKDGVSLDYTVISHASQQTRSRCSNERISTPAN